LFQFTHSKRRIARKNRKFNKNYLTSINQKWKYQVFTIYDFLNENDRGRRKAIVQHLIGTMTLLTSILLIVGVFCQFCVAWWGAGHLIVAQIAYDELKSKPADASVSCLRLSTMIVV
jgi:hypothetical protein